jgi:glycosyltransferase involved in cell wall biosynthesis
MKKVVLLQRILPHYRVPFVRALQERLSAVGIDLVVVYGQQWKDSVPRTVRIEEPWAHCIKNYYVPLSGTTLVLQCVGSLLRHADLVVVEHANRLLVNYWLLVTRRLTRRKIAFFGHGKNFQGRGSTGLNERLRCITLRHADWWLAYTEASRQAVVDAGFPQTRVTVINNTVDTRLLAQSLSRVNEAQLEALRSRLGLRGANIGIFCGGMYPEKGLEFLLRACLRIRALVPEFEMILVGDGPSKDLAVASAAEFDWIHFVGSKIGDDLAEIYRLGKVLLMPGVLGLVIIDSFVAALPLFTTNSSAHGPEIDYLQNGVNGVSVEQDVEVYANIVAEHLVCDEKRHRLIEGCKASARTFSLDAMVARFASSIQLCLMPS